MVASHVELRKASFIRNNATMFGGGGAYIGSNSTVDATFATFTGNDANEGGGIYVLNSTLLANNAVFNRNNAVRILQICGL